MSSRGVNIKPLSSSDNPIRKKVESLVSRKLHSDQDFLQMIDYVAPMVNEIDIHVERKLMYELEERKIKANREYLNAFGLINDRVQDFAAKVTQLNNICQDMTNKIQSNKAKTQDLLARTAALQNEKKTLEKKKLAIDDFLSCYSLSPEEEAVLKGSESDGTIDAKFFAALQRVKQIHDDSKQLLRTSGEHLAALEIMEEMAKKLEEAYEVLYRSIQRECRLLNVDFLELKGVLVQSIAALQDREVLFKYALDEYTMARRNHVVRAYIDALTRGGAGGTPKPIELLSHDSLRYVGDMLAWIHQAIATERELLQAFLNLCSSDVFKENSIAIQSQISEALCRPFKVRVEQALTTETNCIVLYRLSCLFTFYLETMTSSLSPNSLLIQTFKELKELTLNLFFSGLHSAVQKLIGKMGTPDYNLLPVAAVHQVLMLLKDILESHDATVVTMADKKENFEKTDANIDVLVSEQATYIITQTGLIELYRKAAAHQPSQGALSEINGMEPYQISSTLLTFDSFLTSPDQYKLDQGVKLSSARLRDTVRERTIENVVAAYRIIYDKVVDPGNKYSQLSIKTAEEVQELLKKWT